MTKISNQYSLTNILTADLANSRLGINNVSPTVALDVTGAGKFSGALGGTSATFSANGSSFGSASVGSYPLTIQTNTNEQSIKFIGKNNNNNVQFFDSAGTTYQAVVGTIGNDFIIGTGTSGTTRLTIASTGAATFSSSVTAGAQVAITTTSTTAALQITLPANANATILQSTGSNSGYGWKLQQEEVSTGDFRIFRREASVDYQVLNLARSTGAATFSNLITVSGFGNSTFSSGGTGYNKLTIRNTTAGTGNGAQLSIGTDADPDQFYVQSFATTFTTSGMNIAGGAVVNGEGPGGLSIAATQSNIGFYTNGAGAANLRMTITSAGNVGIGVTSLVSPGGSRNLLQISNGTNGAQIALGNSTTESNNARIFSGQYDLGFAAGVTTGIMQFYTNDTERMRITSGGAVQINTTVGAATLNMKSQASGAILRFQNNSSGDGTIFAYGTSTSLDYAFNTYSVANAFYLYNNGNYSFAGSNVSDKRLKENIKNIDYNAIEKLIQLVPKSYNMINHPDIKRNGFIAQEVKEILPDLITGTETDEEYLGLDYNGLLTLAVKAIQELSAKVSLLENK